jgi:hypothetical protein
MCFYSTVIQNAVLNWELKIQCNESKDKDLIVGCGIEILSTSRILKNNNLESYFMLACFVFEFLLLRKMS